MEAEAQDVIAIVGAGDLDIAGQLLIHENDGLVVVRERFIEGVGEETRFEASRAEEGLLSKGDALDGEEFLSVDRLIDGNEVVLKASDFIEAHDCKVRRGEAMLAGVLGGTSFAFRRTRAGGMLRVGLVGSALFVGN